MTALGLLAFLSAGHTPDVGKYGLTVRNALDHLVNINPDNGWYGGDGARMYGHCIITIALAHAYGIEEDETQRRKLRSCLDKAMHCIIAAQQVGKDGNSIGGWRYERNSSDSDLSCTTWCLLALSACRDAGLSPPRESFERALRYVLRCYRGRDGGFSYLVGAQISPSMTAAGLLNLHLLGVADRDEAADAARTLINKPVRGGTNFYCAVFYAVLAGHVAGEDVWPALWKNAHEQLLPAQRRDDGSWPARPDEEPAGQGKPSRFYPTAMSVLTLAIPLRLLPLYDR
jgi:hypothetical protein